MIAYDFCTRVILLRFLKYAVQKDYGESIRYGEWIRYGGSKTLQRVLRHACFPKEEGQETVRVASGGSKFEYSGYECRSFLVRKGHLGSPCVHPATFCLPKALVLDVDVVVELLELVLELLVVVELLELVLELLVVVDVDVELRDVRLDVEVLLLVLDVWPEHP